MISLITATLGRTHEVKDLLVSLDKQSYRDFEIIIVDQNEHHEIEDMVSSFPGLNLVYIRSSRKGLSLNRNIGLSYAKGEIIGFPDDDCFYDDNLLEKVNKRFLDKGDSCKMVAVQAKDLSSDFIFIKTNEESISRIALSKKCISFNLFMRRKEGMRFDELLGVGAYFGSGEETDFLWENITNGDECVFTFDTFVHHPHNTAPVDNNRAYKYGLGMGAIYKKEVFKRKHYGMIYRYFIMLARPFVGMIVSRSHRFYWETLKGRVIGFLKYPV